MKLETGRFKEKCRRGHLNHMSGKRDLENNVQIKWDTNVDGKIVSNKFVYTNLSEEIVHKMRL